MRIVLTQREVARALLLSRPDDVNPLVAAGVLARPVAYTERGRPFYGVADVERAARRLVREREA